jgi:hypothetical protein
MANSKPGALVRSKIWWITNKIGHFHSYKAAILVAQMQKDKLFYATHVQSSIAGIKSLKSLIF